jgi:hypothetical protein
MRSDLLLNLVVPSDAHTSQFISNIAQILASSKSPDDISLEILDLLGLDFFEVTSEITQHRNALVPLVSSWHMPISSE